MRRIIRLLAPAVTASVLLASCGSSSGGSASSSTAATNTPAAASTAGAPSGAVVKTASNAKLGNTILVDAQGMTLYHLTAEHSGQFVCTSSCLQTWHPLSTQASIKPSGSVSSLSVITRPDGTKQVTYRGQPLYTFAQDQNPGDANGQGVKDVGTWTAISTSGSISSGHSASSSTPAPQPAAPSGGGY
jgi:predicted lipoprotein with Yx(FWY)xxD motif